MRAVGFTLVEMLIALAVFAVVAVVVQGNIGGVARSLGQLEERVFANWIAQNHIAEQVLNAERNGSIDQSSHARLQYGGQQWELSSTLEDTPILHLKKITVEVCKSERDCQEPFSRFILAQP